MRTQEQIVARMKGVSKDDFLGFRSDVLLSCLDFEHAKEWLKPEATKEKWEAEGRLTEAVITEAAKNYLEFAWGKAEDHRGLSASRSTEKMGEYIWLLGTDADFEAYDKVEYAQYGCPKLKWAAEFFKTPIPTDEGLLNMMKGEPCSTGCDSGCGS